MIEITPTFHLDENDVQFDFVRASGPGGQNVNKVATAVQLRFDVAHSSQLSEVGKQRLMRLAGSRMTTDGVLVLEAKRFRTQEQNREDALQRLVELIRRALQSPRERRATRPTRASNLKRLEKKKKHAANKKSRRVDSRDWE